jgi:hypothetical protein
MPLLRSRAAVRRARWAFLKVFFLTMGLLSVLFVLFMLVRLVGA